MKTLHYLLFFITAMSVAQIKGNKSIETRNFDVNNLTHVKINLYAEVVIDQSAPEGMTITTDSNLFEYIDTSVEDGILDLDQIEWISASQAIQIRIGAPKLTRVESGTHDTTKIINVNNQLLRINAPIGNLIIEGKTQELRIGSELATVDARRLEAKNAFINIWNYGKVIVNVKEQLWADVSNDGKLIYVNAPESIQKTSKKGGQIYSLTEAKTIKNPEAEYIRFKIKNNSKNRNQFYVIGPKPDGSKFSYGFPMMPNAKRHENWTVGTKVYKVNSLGFKKLLVTISKSNENQIVELFN